MNATANRSLWVFPIRTHSPLHAARHHHAAAPGAERELLGHTLHTRANSSHEHTHRQGSGTLRYHKTILLQLHLKNNKGPRKRS